MGGPGSHCNAGSAEFYACSVGRKSGNGSFLGNSCCNLLQPFWLIPVLEVAKLKVRDVMGYCVICLIALLVIISAGLLFYNELKEVVLTLPYK